MKNQPQKPGVNNFKHLVSCAGYSILELVTVIVILAMLTTLVSTVTGNSDKDLEIAAALKDMKAIQTALVDGVVPDLGFIPCGISGADTDERRSIESLFIPAYLFMERGTLQEKMGLDEDDCYLDGYVDEYGRYESKGWQGPYMKTARAMIDATYFAPENFPETASGSHVYMNTIPTPWADTCEELALDAETDGDSDLAEDYRRGKYYQIVYPQMTQSQPQGAGNIEALNSTSYKMTAEITGWRKPYCQVSRFAAYIVNRGPDCLPPQEENQVDVADKVQCEAGIMEKTFSELGLTESTIAQLLNNGLLTLEELNQELEQELNKNCGECYDDGDAVPLSQRLSITDPDDEYYMDIGDDLIISVFGKAVRSPLDE